MSSPETAEPVLEIENFSVTYRGDQRSTRAVRGVDLALRPGEVLGLAGESGSGKSTLVYGACRLLRPPAVITGGSVTYRGRRGGGQSVDLLRTDRDALRRLRWREISLVFQSAMNALNPVLRIEDQIGDAIDAHLNLSRSDRRERLERLMDMVGIPRDRLRSYPHQLSGGMRQRVMIAMSLAADPEIVIMDEPTTALDVVVQRDILAQISELRASLGFAIIFITHDLSLLLEIADRVAIMYAGQIVELAEVQEIGRRPQHPYTRGLLGSFASLSGPRRVLTSIPGSPPDLSQPQEGCPFAPRCSFAIDECRSLDMSLWPVEGSENEHLTACPFVGDVAQAGTSEASEVGP